MKLPSYTLREWLEAYALAGLLIAPGCALVAGVVGLAVWWLW
ncbi:MAG: hypothetical protein ACREK4_13475 [Candidatus Rokuibacteriota bacterium]